jgi:hypothetical protein
MNVNQWFARQHGIITLRQAAEAGMTRRQVDYLLHQGEWVRVARDVYRHRSHPVTDRQRAFAAVLAAGPRAWLSHDSAAAVFGAPGFNLDHLHVTVPRGVRRRLHIATVHETDALARVDFSTFQRMPVTSPARTLIDIATGDPTRTEDAVDELLCRGSLSLGHQVRRARALQQRGRPGPTRLLEVLDAWSQDEARSTRRELRVIRFITEAGLPAPVRQLQIYDRHGRPVARVDAGVPEDKAAVEFQSFRWHATRRAFERDQERIAILTALGWRFYPVTQHDLRDSCRRLIRWLDELRQARAA